MIDRTYIAKGPHKRPCDLCGTPILPGDAVRSWCWAAETPRDSNIMRVHGSCRALQIELRFDEWIMGEAFTDAGCQDRALALLEAARKVTA